MTDTLKIAGVPKTRLKFIHTLHHIGKTKDNNIIEFAWEAILQEVEKRLDQKHSTVKDKRLEQVL